MSSRAITIVSVAAVSVVVLLVQLISGTTVFSAPVGVTGIQSPVHAIELPQALPVLPETALEPHISAATLNAHYHGHQRGYIVKLNAWIASQPENQRSLMISDPEHSSVITELLRSSSNGGVSSSITNLVAQIFNHALYFACLTGNEALRALDTASPLAQAIDRDFGSWDAFWQTFKSRSLSHFGSGWTWLVHNRTSNRLEVIDTHDAHTPVVKSDAAMFHAIVPLTVCDVWEHAYYLDRKWKRDEYLEGWRSVVNWNLVNRRFVGGWVEYRSVDGSYPNFVPLDKI